MGIKNILKPIYLQLISDGKYLSFLRNKGLQIGEGCDIERSVNFGSEPWLIKIGNKVRLSKGVEFITHDGGIWVLRNLGLTSPKSVKYGSIQIGNNVNVGWNAVIMPGVRIGDNCIIAAGAIVTKDVPSGTIWGGVPRKTNRNDRSVLR